MQTQEDLQTFNENLELSSPGQKFRRRPVLAHDRSRSTAALIAHQRGKRLSRGERERLHAARSFVLTPIDPEPKEAKPEAVKLAVKFTTLKLKQLLRARAKYARLASRAKHILAKMSPDSSRLRTAVQTQQDLTIAMLGQVNAEIQARKLACEGKLDGN